MTPKEIDAAKNQIILIYSVSFVVGLVLAVALVAVSPPVAPGDDPEKISWPKREGSDRG